MDLKGRQLKNFSSQKSCEVFSVNCTQYETWLDCDVLYQTDATCWRPLGESSWLTAVWNMFVLFCDQRNVHKHKEQMNWASDSCDELFCFLAARLLKSIKTWFWVSKLLVQLHYYTAHRSWSHFTVFIAAVLLFSRDSPVIPSSIAPKNLWKWMTYPGTPTTSSHTPPPPDI